MNLFKRTSKQNKKNILQKAEHTQNTHRFDSFDEFCQAIAPIVLIIGGALLIILLLYHIAPAFADAFRSDANTYEHLGQIVCYIGGI